MRIKLFPLALIVVVVLTILFPAKNPIPLVLAKVQDTVISVEPSLTPAYGGGMCSSAWHQPYTNGPYLTVNTNNPAQSTNWAEWRPNITVAGRYKVEALIRTHDPIHWYCPPSYDLNLQWDTSDARYTIHHAGGEITVTRDQAPLFDQWLDLGTYDFNIGTNGWVKLVDLNGEPNLSRTVSFSTVRFTLVTPPPPEYNTAWLTDAMLEGEYDTSVAAIRAFLQKQRSCLTNPIKDVDGVTIDIPVLIHDAAVKYHINPKVILATMQKEQSAITRCPETWRLKLLLGAGQPSTARQQIDFGTSLFRAYQDELNSGGQTRSGWKVGVAKQTQDGVSVTPATNAVAGQFTYTPYAGVNWSGNLPNVGGVWLFWNSWYNLFHFDQPLSAPPSTCEVPFFSQRDSRWINHPLRGCSAPCNTIGACGCTLTSATMLFAYYGANLTPPTLSDCMGNWACPFYWGTGATCSQGKAQWVALHNFSWGRLEQELNQNKRPVILGMTKGSNMHWVLVLSGNGTNPNNYVIHDPWPINGAKMRLSAYNSWSFNWLAIYAGQSNCGGMASSVNELTTSQYGVLETPSSASNMLKIAEVRNLETSDVISGSVWLYHMTDVTMTVQLIADSTAGHVTEALVWTDVMTQSSWQEFSTFVVLPRADEVYARFKDESDNISTEYTETSYPPNSPEAPRLVVYLPLMLRNH